MTFEEDSFVQIVAPNGDYRYGYVKGADEGGQHLTICMHEEAESKLAYEAATNLWNGQAPIGWQYGLTGHELHVLTLLSKDPNTARIAQQLKLQPTTIRGYLRTLRLKLRVDNRAQLVMVAQAMEKSLQDRAEEK
jgi:DNA-binding NarL/FixJ family response regulator